MWERLKAIPRGVRRFTGSGALAVLLLVVGAPMAFAKSQTPPALFWITLKDSHGIPLWNHELSIDRGGVMAPDKTIYSFAIDNVWGLYKSYVALTLWFLDWVLSFAWLKIIAAPILIIASALQQVVDELGVGTVFLTITVVVGGLMWLRGRGATGLYEIGVAMVIATLASGVLANPVKLVVGDDGYIMSANKLGQEISNALTSASTGTDATAETARQQQIGKMVDVFIRQPLQMINYGTVLDGGKCEGAYNEVVKDGPYGDESTIRDKIAACDSELGDVAASPNHSMALSANVIMPAGYLVVTLLLLVAGSVIAAGGWAIYQSVRAIWALLQGTLPGGSRAMLFSTVGSLIEALVTIVVANIFLGVTMLVLQAVFGQPDSVAMRFVIADVIIAVAVVVWWRTRRRLKSMGRRLAEWMSQRPGGAPTKIAPATQRKPGQVLASAGRLAMQAWQVKQMKGMATPSNSLGIQNNTVVIMGQPGQMQPGGGGGYAYQTHPAGPGAPQLPGGGQGQLPAGPGGATGPGGNPGGGGGGQPPALAPGGGGAAKALPRGSGLARIEGRRKSGGIIRPLVTTAATVALAAATGGASTAVAGASKAAMAVRSARRIQLLGRLSHQAVSGVGRALSGRPSQPAPQALAGPVVTGRVLDAPQPASATASARPPRVAKEPRPLEVKPVTPVAVRTNHTKAADAAAVAAARSVEFKARLANRMRRGR